MLLRPSPRLDCPGQFDILSRRTQISANSIAPHGQILISRFVVNSRQIFAEGHEFSAGAYEKLVGKAYGEVDPKAAPNCGIVNLDKAPRNSSGRVEYSSDFLILKPVDMRRGNGKILYDPANRGLMRLLVSVNDALLTDSPSTLEHAGNGFLMNEGYTVLSSGWQGDLVPARNCLALAAPVALDGDRPIVRRIRVELVIEKGGVFSYPLSGDPRIVSYEAAAEAKASAVLTVRERADSPRITVSPADWDFAVASRNAKTGERTASPSGRDLFLRTGFKQNHIYELIYLAKNPPVLGLGFASVRDVVSFLRYEGRDSAGGDNPIAGTIRSAYACGRSQGGRLLRDLIYQGFNEDEKGRKVFDAVAPLMAGAGRIFLNYEFSRPATSSQQHADQLEPELFPFAYNMLRDPQTGRTDGILKRPSTDPLIMHVQGNTEYWQKRGCLVHTDGLGADIELPPNVRVYFIAGSPHMPSPIASSPNYQHPTNQMSLSEAFRALLVALDRWNAGELPPPSQIPAVRNGTLVRPRDVVFPRIPGVVFNGLYNPQLFLDYGPDVLKGFIEVHPPRPIGGEYEILVPSIDEDGNDIPGVRLPQISVPIATLTGWNIYREFARGDLCGFIGSCIPFADTSEERLQMGDPRPSVQERYEDHPGYVRRMRAAALSLVEQRLLLAQDVEGIIEDNHTDQLVKMIRRIRSFVEKGFLGPEDEARIIEREKNAAIDVLTKG